MTPAAVVVCWYIVDLFYIGIDDLIPILPQLASAKDSKPRATAALLMRTRNVFQKASNELTSWKTVLYFLILKLSASTDTE